jgi:hypothetical protein
MISAWRDRALALFFLIPGATARKAPNRDGRHGHLVTAFALSLPAANGSAFTVGSSLDVESTLAARQLGLRPRSVPCDQRPSQ